MVVLANDIGRARSEGRRRQSGSSRFRQEVIYIVLSCCQQRELPIWATTHFSRSCIVLISFTVYVHYCPEIWADG